MLYHGDVDYQRDVSFVVRGSSFGQLLQQVVAVRCMAAKAIFRILLILFYYGAACEEGGRGRILSAGTLTSIVAWFPSSLYATPLVCILHNDLVGCYPQT